MSKKMIVGVSVTPEVGLEVAQIDFASQTVLKYGVRQLEYDSSTRQIADLDLFKEALQDLKITRLLWMKLKSPEQLKKILLTILFLNQQNRQSLQQAYQILQCSSIK